MHKIVGLGQSSRVGKDTLAKFLREDAEKRGLTVQQLAFANPLKDFAHQLFRGVKPRRDYEVNPALRDEKLPYPLNDMNVVDLWIRFGNDMRAIDPDIWANYTLDSIDDTRDLTIITDVRFLNEADGIRDLGGELIKVLRDGQQLRESDTMIPYDYEWDRVIYNNSSLGELRRKANALTREWFGE